MLLPPSERRCSRDKRMQAGIKVAGTALSDLSVNVFDKRVVLSGHLVVWTLSKLSDTPDAAKIDLAAVTRMDTTGAWELTRRRAAGGNLIGLSDHWSDRLSCRDACRQGC